MSIEVWPFLVSRNSYLDYRTVVAPDFICDAKISNLLARVAEGDLTKPDEVIIRQVVNLKVGEFTIVFQVVIAKEKDIAPKGSNKGLADQFGREIYLFKGVVIKGIGDDYIYVDDKDIEIADKQLIEVYRKFWNCIKPDPATPSSQFSVEKVSSERLLTHKIKPRFNATLHNKKSLSQKNWALKREFHQTFPEKIISVAFSPDGSSIAVQDKYLKTVIWKYVLRNHIPDVIEPRMINLPVVGNDYEHSVCFSPDGKFIAFVSIRSTDKNLIELYDLQSRKQEKIFRGHKFSQWGRITSIAFDPKGNFLASASQDKSVKIWNVLTEQETETASLPHNNPVTTIAISHDGYRLASGDECGNIKVWNLKTYEEQFSIKTALSLVKSIAFSPNGKVLAAGGETRNNYIDAQYIQAWNSSNGRNQEIPISNKDPHGDVVNSVAFSSDGEILASAGKDKKIVFWDVNTIREISPLFPPKESAHSDEITSIAFDPKGNYLASGGKDKIVSIWSF